MLKLVEFSAEYLESAAELYVLVFNAPPWNDAWTVSAAHERLARIIAHRDHTGVVATEANTILGFATGWRHRWIKADHFHLLEMCVVAERQRQGIGSAIMGELTRRLREFGVEAMYLETHPSGPAEAFYAKHGFRAMRLRSMLRKEGTQEQA